MKTNPDTEQIIFEDWAICGIDTKSKSHRQYELREKYKEDEIVHMKLREAMDDIIKHNKKYSQNKILKDKICHS